MMKPEKINLDEISRPQTSTSPAHTIQAEVGLTSNKNQEPSSSLDKWFFLAETIVIVLCLLGLILDLFLLPKLSDFDQVMIVWGGILLPVLIYIAKCGYLSVRYCFSPKFDHLRNLNKALAEFMITSLFDYKEALSFNAQAEIVDFEKENSVYINTRVTKEQFSVLHSARVRVLFAGYFNGLIVYLGYFAIQTYWLYEVFSPVCLAGYVCESKDYAICPLKGNQRNLTGGQKEVNKQLICSQYRIIWNEVGEKMAIVTGVYAHIKFFNGLLFKLTRKLFNGEWCKCGKSCWTCCCTERCGWFWNALFMILHFGIFGFWVILPIEPFRKLPLYFYDGIARSTVSKLGSIVATTLLAITTAIMLELATEKTHANYSLYVNLSD